MSNKKIALRKDDWIRAVLSETSPAEIPLIISNNGFYLNLTSPSRPKPLNALIDAFFKVTEKKKPSIPYSYKIAKDGDSFRRLSLPHPRAQLEVADFYRRYHTLIAHYCQIGSFSIRRPKRLASHFYLASRNEDALAVRSQDIMAEGLDKTAKHSASVFAYSGYRRLHKFFSSPTYSELERKYRFMASLDVSKCFDSIYTHSIAWSLKSKAEAKATTTSITFGGAFDRLMQNMNHNETNGIIIGPEVSRIFAELIFNRIDADVERYLASKELQNHVDYSVLRYVDNIYVFYNLETTYKSVLSAVRDSLDFYKMSLNESKSELLERPFFTKKSMAISGAEAIVESYFESFIEKQYVEAGAFYYAKQRSPHEADLKNFAMSLRKTCFSSSSGYESVSGFLLAALRHRVQRVVLSAQKVEKYVADGGTLPGFSKITEVRLAMSRYLSRSLDMCMHIYTLSPSVAGSLDVATMIVLSAGALKKCDVDLFVQTRERLQMWVSRLFDSFEMRELAGNGYTTPIEVLNILCALRQFDFDGKYFEELITKSGHGLSGASYFSTVVHLFVLGSSPQHAPSIAKIFDAAEQKILSDVDVASSAESCHMFFDLLSCPFVSIERRRKLFRSVSSAYNDQLQSKNKGGSIAIPKMKNTEIDALISHMESNPWFVDWTEINLLRLIERKRLKAGYE